MIDHPNGPQRPLPPQVFLEGDTILAQGDAGREMFFIARGAVRVARNGVQVALLRGASPRLLRTAFPWLARGGAEAARSLASISAE